MGAIHCDACQMDGVRTRLSLPLKTYSPSPAMTSVE